MGFYFRKSKSIGPFRLNFSKSGIGVSTGIKGARISFGPKGTYVNVGRKGIYYRKKISSSKRKNTRGFKGNEDLNKIAYMPSSQPESEMEDAIKFRRSGDNESHIGEIIKKGNTRYYILFLVWLAICVTLAFYIKLWVIPVAIISRIIFDLFFTVKLHFDLDDEASEEWDVFCDELYELKFNKKLWMVESSSFVGNSKINAGVSRNITRSVAHLKRRPAWQKALDFIVADVPKIEIQGSRYSILFLPSDVVVSRRGTAVAFPYSQVSIRDSTIRFVEHGKLEKDAYVTGYTNQYVNRDGSADLRYKSNPEIPVCRYGTLVITAGDSLRIEVQTSNDETVRGISKAFRYYKDYYADLEKRADNSEYRYGKELNHNKSTYRVLRADEIDRQTLEILKKGNGIVIETGKNAIDVIETILSCSISIVDGALHNCKGLVLYEADDRVDFKIEKLQQAFDDRFSEDKGFEFSFEPVSQTRFLAYISINGFKNMPAELEISEQLTNAIRYAQNYEVVIEKKYPKPKSEVVPPVAPEISEETKHEPEIEPQKEDDPFEELFLTDENNDQKITTDSIAADSEESKKVDDIMDFFE